MRHIATALTWFILGMATASAAATFAAEQGVAAGVSSGSIRLSLTPSATEHNTSPDYEVNGHWFPGGQITSSSISRLAMAIGDGPVTTVIVTPR